jgi:hypothetical protein
MADEMIAPLMGRNDNQDENNDNEVSPLLNYNKEEKILNIQNINNSNRISNKELNDNQRLSLIFLSFAVQILIYFLLLLYFNDKDNFIKQHINIFFAISIIIVFFLIIIHIYNLDFFKRISFIKIILISLISSFGLFCFLYKFSIAFTLDKIKYILLIVCSMYLNVSIYYGLDVSKVYLEREELFISNILPFLISTILIIYQIFDIEAFLYNCLLSFFLNSISMIHINYLVKKKHWGIKDYPIINICFFIDLFIISIMSYYFYLYEKIKMRQNRTRYRYKYKYSTLKNEEKKGNLNKIIISPYDIFHPNDTNKYYHQ